MNFWLKPFTSGKIASLQIVNLTKTSSAHADDELDGFIIFKFHRKWLRHGCKVGPQTSTRRARQSWILKEALTKIIRVRAVNIELYYVYESKIWIRTT